jgi:hypothetical protein
MSVLAFAIEASKLAIMAIILWYVCEVLAMPLIPKRVCQMLIVFIAILAAIQIATAGTMPSMSHTLTAPPSIMAPPR